MSAIKFLDGLSAKYTVGTSASTYTPAQEPDSVVLVNRGSADVHFAFDGAPTTFATSATEASPVVPAQSIGGVMVAWEDGASSLQLVTDAGSSDVLVMAAREVRT